MNSIFKDIYLRSNFKKASFIRGTPKPDMYLLHALRYDKNYDGFYLYKNSLILVMQRLTEKI